MELRNLETFCMIYKLKSFTKAAKELGYAQSTVTTQIKILERELGVQLFERIGRNIELTSKGEIFLEYATQILELSNKTIEAVSEKVEPDGVLTIGVAESLCTMMFHEPLKKYHEKYPNVDIIIKVATYRDLLDMIKNNRADFVLMIGEKVNDFDLECIMHYDEEMVILASPRNPLTDKKKLKIKDLENQPLILTEQGCSYRAAFKRRFKEEGIEPHISLEVGGLEAIKKLTMGNLGITLLPLMSVREEINSKKLISLNLIDCEFKIVTQLMYHRNKWFTAAMKAFIDEFEIWINENISKNIEFKKY
ncbi:MAG: LysR family transcriptional regulator [Intestinibacter sp.]|uniref:LysR family transcriptional regulator n=1 Tax=Intestinibacter sp. TaxID=1965304 RepID=UPI003F14D493